MLDPLIVLTALIEAVDAEPGDSNPGDSGPAGRWFALFPGRESIGERPRAVASNRSGLRIDPNQDVRLTGIGPVLLADESRDRDREGIVARVKPEALRGVTGVDGADVKSDVGQLSNAAAPGRAGKPCWRSASSCARRSSSTEDGPNMTSASDTGVLGDATSATSTVCVVAESPNKFNTASDRLKINVRIVAIGDSVRRSICSGKSDLQNSHRGAADEVERIVHPPGDAVKPLELLATLQIVVEEEKAVVAQERLNVENLNDRGVLAREPHAAAEERRAKFFSDRLALTHQLPSDELLSVSHPWGRHVRDHLDPALNVLPDL